VVNDPGGEPLACAAKALDMPSAVFQRVLLFLNPEFGSSVNYVYRLSRLYDILSERSALVILAAWRGSTMAATRAKYRSSLYDDERHRVRSVPLKRGRRRNCRTPISHRAGVRDVSICAYSNRKTGTHPRIKSEGMLLRKTR
jgi:hypothetical protein